MHSTPNQDKTDVLLLHPPFSVTYLIGHRASCLSKYVQASLSPTTSLTHPMDPLGEAHFYQQAVWSAAVQKL